MRLELYQFQGENLGFREAHVFSTEINVQFCGMEREQGSLSKVATCFKKSITTKKLS